MASALIYTWYWLVYAINVFVYVIYLPRCREAILTLLSDLCSPVSQLQRGTRTRTQTETDWGVRMGRLTRDHSLELTVDLQQSHSVEESEGIPRICNVIKTESKSTQT